MLMKILILIVMIAWLAASLPQTRFIWIPTVYEQGSFDWWAANLRAIIIDFLPLAVVFVESQLLNRHIDKARRSFGKRKDKDEFDFDVWQETYPTTEKSVSKQMPRLFVMSTLVISISYWAYYTEFGRDLALYHIAPLGLSIGSLVKFLVLVVYLTISALFTYGWGKLMSAFEAHTVLEDFGKWVKKSFKPLSTKSQKFVPETREEPRSGKGKKKLSPKERRDALYEIILEDPNQKTKNLAKRFGVSDQTIRDDYRVLVSKGKIMYRRGKVVIPLERGDF